MKKNDIASIFTDIDDEFIASAKPMAQKPVELIVEKRRFSWKTFSAAAACLTVLAVGSAIAVKVVNPGQAAAPSSSGGAVLSNDSNENSSTNEPVKPIGDEKSLLQLPTMGLDSDWYYENHETDSWHNDSKIHFYGVDYKVLNSREFDGIKFLVGSDQVEDMIEFVAAVENTTDKPIMLYVPYSRDNDRCSNIIGTHTEIAVNIEKDGVKLCDADADEDHLTDDQYLLVVQPGETYYQRMRFDTYHGRYCCDITSLCTPVPEGIYNGTATVSLVSESGDVSVHSLDFDLNVTMYTGMPECSITESKWRVGTEFIYEGKSYKVLSVGSCGSISRNNDGTIKKDSQVYEVTGVRRETINGQDTVEFVAFVENNTDSSIGLMGSVTSPDKPFLFKFDVDENLVDSHHVFDDEVFNTAACILQPGETYYQKASFPVTEAEYRFSSCLYYFNTRKYAEEGMLEINGGTISNNWADFTDKSVDNDNVNKLFGRLGDGYGGSSFHNNDVEAKFKDKEFGGHDNDSGFSY